ncbi:MAG: ammonium transporter, partial [Microcystaceae cyanobacterium]
MGFLLRFRLWFGSAIAALLVVLSHQWVLAQSLPGSSVSIEKSLTGMSSLSGLINSLWLLLAFLLVMGMYGGFGLLTAGFCRAKNTVNILSTHLMIFIISTFSFWVLGFALMFGKQGNGFIGAAPWFLGSDNPIAYGFAPLPNGLPIALVFLFQSALAGLTATIVAGAIAERVKFRDFLLFTIPLVGIAYALVGHWVWGDGWLARMGFQDFAGSSVIHCVGGWAAFSGLAILGPRMGKYETKRTNRLPSHSLSLAFAGCFLVWLGWLGLVGGKDLALTSAVPSLWLTVNFAAGASGLVAMGISNLISRKTDPFLLINGVLAGLVAISASCNQISLGAALFVGAIAGLLTVSFIHWFDQVHLDDPVGALSVHLIGGLWGTLAVGIFDS